MKTIETKNELYKNLYKENEIPTTHINYFNERMKGKDIFIPEFLRDKVSIYYECKQDTNYEGVITHYIEHHYIMMEKNGILCMLMMYKGKYYFHPYYSHKRKVHKIDSYIIRERENEMKQPNFIGTFSEKKVNDWLTYCEELVNLWENIFVEYENKGNKNEEQIKNFIESIPSAKVEKYSRYTKVTTKHFNVLFEIFEGSQYMSTKIEFTGGLQGVINIENNK